MMKFYQNYSLSKLNTFGININADYFASFSTLEELKIILEETRFKNLKKLILGGGSNILFTTNYTGLVLKNSFKGIEVTHEDDDYVVVKSGAGEIWHDFVIFCINQNFGGVENLSLIPGTVGASPIQNIGAYGVEIKDTLEYVEAYDIEEKVVKTFSNKDCMFGYRDSIFKKELKGRVVITTVSFRLKKKPVLNISYGAIKDTLEAKAIESPTIRDVSEAVCEIRKSKLPDPYVLGNAGSFFKNPEVNVDIYTDLKSKFQDIPNYPTKEGYVKIPAGWLIEKCDWKGKKVGNAGVHKNQALVIVNYGNASGNEIRILSEKIQKSVFNMFGINLEVEVNII